MSNPCHGAWLALRGSSGQDLRYVRLEGVANDNLVAWTGPPGSSLVTRTSKDPGSTGWMLDAALSPWYASVDLGQALWKLSHDLTLSHATFYAAMFRQVPSLAGSQLATRAAPARPTID